MPAEYRDPFSEEITEHDPAPAAPAQIPQMAAEYRGPFSETTEHDPAPAAPSQIPQMAAEYRGHYSEDTTVHALSPETPAQSPQMDDEYRGPFSEETTEYTSSPEALAQLSQMDDEYRGPFSEEATERALSPEAPAQITPMDDEYRGSLSEETTVHALSPEAPAQIPSMDNEYRGPFSEETTEYSHSPEAPAQISLVDNEYRGTFSEETTEERDTDYAHSPEAPAQISPVENEYRGTFSEETTEERDTEYAHSPEAPAQISPMTAEYRGPFSEETTAPATEAPAQTPPASPIASLCSTRDEPTMSGETGGDALQHPDRPPPPPPAPLDSSELLGSLLATIPTPEDPYDSLGIGSAQQQHDIDEEMDSISPATEALQWDGRRNSNINKRADDIEYDSDIQEGKPQITLNTTARAVSNGSRVRISEASSISSLGDGSMMEESETMLPAHTPAHTPGTMSVPSRKVSPPSIADGRSMAAKSIRSIAVSTMTPEDEVLSLRVRSLYDSGVGVTSDTSSLVSADTNKKRISSILEERSARLNQRQHLRSSFPGAGPSRETVNGRLIGRSVEDLSTLEREAELEEERQKRESRASAALEDWEDLEGHEVDRYGFINPIYISSSAPTPNGAKAPKRVATALFAQTTQEPRKRTLRRLRLSPSAPEMLRMPTNQKQLREKEDLRSRKWKAMAIPQTRSESGKGRGIEWTFQTKDHRLIKRVWKGIPDCWRGAAWHAFMTASSKARGVGQSDAELVTRYYEHIDLPSADDVQIDLDVPRTISSHIMFRRRYRGGQRLLFRVLHALSLHFPEIGYVQGMAGLAATLLCYYDEELSFIMLVRLWELRGLEQLYRSGFGGLIAALEEFEGKWMKHSPVGRKLASLNVPAMTYGTRWYLTLFNYSIPFAAQLRIWDVLMLLGDPDPRQQLSNPGEHEYEFCGTLDILHATSAAILDGMKGILLNADFEDAMKSLTSFIPLKDEDMLMKVVKVEWKRGRRKRRVSKVLGGG